MRPMWLTVAAACVSVALQVVMAAPARAGSALVVQDAVAMRAAAKDSSPAQAQLWRGEALEIRGERFDHYQVYDYRRERGGFVRKSQLLALDGPAGDPAALLAALRLVRQQAGAESLGLGLAAAYVQAASAEQMNGRGGAEALAAMGLLAERLADRASRVPSKADATPGAAETQLAAQMDVAARYGLRFRTFEREAGALQVCYDGDAFRRLLALPAASGEQQARAALALTRQDCLDQAATPSHREQIDQWRAAVLDKVDAKDLPAHWRNRVLMRQVNVWSSLSFARARRAGLAAETGPASAAEAATRALEFFVRVTPADLSDDDQPAYNDAAMRGNASRWFAIPATPADQALAGLQLSVRAGQPGETCLTLTVPNASDALLRHCGWGLLMTSSARINREGNAIVVASLPADGWRELWVMRRTAQGWRLTVLPPAPAQPGLGYAEFAGWVPGGKELLVARESRAEGRYRRSYELVDLDTLEVRRQAGEVAMLGAFQRWQAAEWKGASLSLR